uniref:Uncharacterized protein n=1 Tax=Trypanosoma congolense (strain IL3000) TaxID=1068625 RepID=G0UP45_TRYCI|nr:conserved hypothetical protein [Trypanosoma congolense IL3000]
MESLKGIARRVTQSIKEKVNNAELTKEDEALRSASTKVRQLEKVGKSLEAKFIRASALLEELSGILKEIGSEYLCVPDIQPESEKIARDMFSLGNRLMESSISQRRELKEEGTDMLTSFLKNVAVLNESEEMYRKLRLEYNFQREKVWKLRREEGKDSDRLVRNESRLEDWHVRLWSAGEKSRSSCSRLYYDGRTSIDLSILGFTRVLREYFGALGTQMKEKFSVMQLPTYSTEPILPPTQMPRSAARIQQPVVGHTSVNLVLPEEEPEKEAQNDDCVDSTDG